MTHLAGGHRARSQPLATSSDWHAPCSSSSGAGPSAPITVSRNLNLLFASDSSHRGTPASAGSATLIARGLPNRRILLVGHDPLVRWVVSSAAQELQAEVRGLDSSDQLELILRASPFDLVVVCGAAAAGDAEQLLRRVPRARPQTPCLIATFIHPCLAQVVVMDSAGRPASTKVVDFGNLGRLPGLLLAGTDPWFSVD